MPAKTVVTFIVALAASVSSFAGSTSAQPPASPAPRGDSLGADWREQQGEARAKVLQGRHVPLDRVIAEIRRKTPGRLLDTGIEQGPGGRSVYRVRWATTGGRRIDFLVDAESGAIVSGG